MYEHAAGIPEIPILDFEVNLVVYVHAVDTEAALVMPSVKRAAKACNYPFSLVTLVRSSRRMQIQRMLGFFQHTRLNSLHVLTRVAQMSLHV